MNSFSITAGYSRGQGVATTTTTEIVHGHDCLHHVVTGRSRNNVEDASNAIMGAAHASMFAAPRFSGTRGKWICAGYTTTLELEDIQYDQLHKAWRAAIEGK
jgi:hypothetical protein